MRIPYLGQFAQRLGYVMQFSTQLAKVTLQSPGKFIQYQYKPIDDSLSMAKVLLTAAIKQLMDPGTSITTDTQAQLTNGMSRIKLECGDNSAEYLYSNSDNTGFWEAVIIGDTIKTLANPDTEILIERT